MNKPHPPMENPNRKGEIFTDLKRGKDGSWTCLVAGMGPRRVALAPGLYERLVPLNRDGAK